MEKMIDNICERDNSIKEELLQKDKMIESLKELVIKNDLIIKTFHRWKNVSNSGGKLCELLDDMGYCNIAVYGYGHVGKALVKELCYQGVNVVAIIDKDSSLERENISIYPPEHLLEEVDLTIVTSEFYYMQIRQQLKNIGHKEAIYSLDELLEQIG